MATNNATNTSSPISSAQGGFGMGSITTDAVLVGNGTGAIVEVGPGASNSLLMGTGGTPQFTTSGTAHFTAARLGAGTNLVRYITGTFNPTIINDGAAPAVTYSYQLGRYTRVGRWVFVNLRVALATYTAGTGNTNVSALPVNVSASAQWSVSTVGVSNVTMPNPTYLTTASLSGPSVYIYSYASANAGTSTTAAQTGAASIYTISTIYES